MRPAERVDDVGDRLDGILSISSSIENNLLYVYKRLTGNEEEQMSHGDIECHLDKLTSVEKILSNVAHLSSLLDNIL